MVVVTVPTCRIHYTTNKSLIGINVVQGGLMLQYSQLATLASCETNSAISLTKNGKQISLFIVAGLSSPIVWLPISTHFLVYFM